jgi:hypothetical protein
MQFFDEASTRGYVEDILRRPDANHLISPVFRVEGFWFSAHNPESRTGWRSIVRSATDADGAGMTLWVTLAGHISRDLEGQQVTLDLMFGQDVAVRRFTGTVIDHNEEGADTILLCGTGGYWLDKIKFNERTAFVDQDPEWVIRYCLSKCPYDQSLIEVEPIQMPVYRRDDEEGNTAFPDWAAVGEPLLDLATQETIVYRDTAYNGNVTSYRRLSGASEWEFEMFYDRLGKATSADIEEGPFYQVIVYREDEVGVVERLAEIFVPGSTAPPESVLWIQQEDLSNDSALQIAHDAAERQSGYRKLLSWEERVVHPFLDRGSWVTIIERGYDDAGEFARIWLAEITSVEDTFGLDTRTQTFEAEGTIVGEERIPPAPPPPRGSTDVVQRNLIRYGLDGMPEIENQAWITSIDDYNYEIDVAALQAAGLSISVDDTRNEWTIDTVRSD